MYQHFLIHHLLNGIGSLKGLLAHSQIQVIAEKDHSNREGLISFSVSGKPATDIVAALGKKKIRIHARSNDVFSGNVLNPLNLESVSRVSLAHYNSLEEVEFFLIQLNDIINAL